VELIVEHTHTCYLGDRTHRHDWGYGCGTCPACELRARGWAQYRFSPALRHLQVEPGALTFGCRLQRPSLVVESGHRRPVGNRHQRALHRSNMRE
jgi:hypothetical protein